jgi:hypothetical protein
MQHINLPTDGGHNVWTPTRPTQEGVYWFYGFPWGAERGSGDGPDLLCVLARKVVNGILYSTEGYMLGTDAVGFWTPVTLPAKPNKKNVTDDGKTFRG